VGESIQCRLSRGANSRTPARAGSDTNRACEYIVGIPIFKRAGTQGAGEAPERVLCSSRTTSLSAVDTARVAYSLNVLFSDTLRDSSYRVKLQFANRRSGTPSQWVQVDASRNAHHFWPGSFPTSACCATPKKAGAVQGITRAARALAAPR